MVAGSRCTPSVRPANPSMRPSTPVEMSLHPVTPSFQPVEVSSQPLDLRLGHGDADLRGEVLAAGIGHGVQRFGVCFGPAAPDSGRFEVAGDA